MRRTRHLPVEELAPYLIELANPPQVLNWRDIFQNGAPVELEIGFGKGLFLLNAALSQPEVNFVGVEISRKYQLFTAARIAKRNLRNVRLVKADARLFLRDFVAAGSLRAIHIYFPDPWWKKRHLKRRVFTAELVQQCERVLKPEGRLLLATDVEEYFGVMRELMEGRAGWQQRSEEEVRPPAPDAANLTNYERKFRTQGKAIFRAAYGRQGH